MDDELRRARKFLMDMLRREVKDERVIQAMERLPRELFVPLAYRSQAYEDIPLPIGAGQTISQPYIVALMTSALELQGTDKVLELGTGSGYQAAILCQLVPKGKVITMERISTLAHSARQLLRGLGYKNVEVKLAGQTLGCPEEAPFDAIIVTASVPRLPKELLDQLARHGRMVLPVGSLQEQELIKVLKTDEGYSVRVIGPCRFVPLIGECAWPEDRPLY
jgi:protein-L-isoaspartate(D-aspartate) O-methyltransferase